MTVYFSEGEAKELDVSLAPLTVHICPVCGQEFPSSDSLEQHFLDTHTSSAVDMLFKVSVWTGKWMTVWEDGRQISVLTRSFGGVSKIGITAYYFSSTGQRVEQLVVYPDGSTVAGHATGWQGPRKDDQGRDYCYTYSLPGFRPNQPGVYYGNIRVCGSKLPGGGYATADEVNLILVKLL